MYFLENSIFISYGIKNGCSLLSLGIHLYNSRLLFAVRPYVLLFSNNKTPVNISRFEVIIRSINIIYTIIFILFKLIIIVNFL